MPRTTVHDLIKAATVRRSGVLRPGRPPLLSEEEKDKLVAEAITGWKTRKLPWVVLGKRCGLKASKAIIQRALSQRGYHKMCRMPKTLYFRTLKTKTTKTTSLY